MGEVGDSMTVVVGRVVVGASKSSAIGLCRVGGSKTAVDRSGRVYVISSKSSRRGEEVEGVRGSEILCFL